MRVLPRVSPPERLLYSREEAARLLGGVSVATIRRMENSGKLHPIRLTGRRSGQVFFRASEVFALIEGGSDARG
jgi:Helix-turn-helix domain